MGITTYDNYGRLAESNLSPAEKAGRYAIQAEAEGNIPPDIAEKLELQSSDTVLEIGCGIGNILLPLADLVSSVTGIDHPAVIRALKKRTPNKTINMIAGNFLHLEIEERFDKVLIYSVLHCLSDMDEVEFFTDKALSLVKPGGKMMLGDIPNRDLKARFLASVSGAAFQKEWQETLDHSAGSETQAPALEKDPHTASFGDRDVLTLLGNFRGQGHEAYVLSQNEILPFGHTREDILVTKAII